MLCIRCEATANAECVNNWKVIESEGFVTNNFYNTPIISLLLNTYILSPFSASSSKHYKNIVCLDTVKGKEMQLGFELRKSANLKAWAKKIEDVGNLSHHPSLSKDTDIFKSFLTYLFIITPIWSQRYMPQWPSIHFLEPVLLVLYSPCLSFINGSKWTSYGSSKPFILEHAWKSFLYIKFLHQSIYSR